jgi:hypothetical protein
MKKYIVMSIIAVVALLPFAAWADTGGTADATLTFSAVINMIVDDIDWSDLTIDQPMIADIAGAGGEIGQIDWDDADDDISVTVQAFTSFEVYSSYYATSTGLTLPADLTDADAFMYLDAFALQWEQVIGTTGPFDYTGIPATTELTHLTDWAGTPNMFGPTPGETQDYNVQWDPAQLATAELNTGDTMGVTIYFVVTDSST